MSAPVINAELREKSGKGAARSARREGKVPGVIYGGGQDPVSINVNASELLKQLRSGRFMSTLLDVKIDGKKAATVICRDIQKNLINGLPIHLDLLRVSKKQKITVEVPVEFLNEEDCPGLREGGTLVVVRNEVELLVPASHIPEKLEIDLSAFHLGDVIHISNVALPDDVEPTITDRDFVIANISAPGGGGGESDAEDGEGAEGEAGEAAEN